MKDPLLLTYSVRDAAPNSGPFLFDISSRLQPLSIRDQLFRGHLIVKRALSEGIIQVNQAEPILVIGGGAAGLNATMTAMQHGVPVVLVERERLFATQAPSGRNICASEYDWPASHWSRGNYPANSATMPLQLRTGAAAAILLTWESQLALWKKLYSGILDPQIGREFVRHVPVGNRVRVELNPPNPPLPYFKTVIACGGFGSEKTQGGSQYRGFAFWEADPFDAKNLKISGAKPNVIICGGGDGALQDFLRIISRKTAPDIYKLLPSAATTIIEERISRAEDVALRAFVWSTTGVLDHPIHEKLHVAHQDVVNLLYTDGKLWKSVKRALEPIIGNLDQTLSIRLAFPCEHFSNCYPLNRFLVLLLSQYLESQLKMTVLLPRAKIIDVNSIGHQCLVNPFLCHGQFHEVKSVDATCATFDHVNPATAAPVIGGPFNVVVIRNGISPGLPPLGHTAAALPMRQLIPYDSPW